MFHRDRHGGGSISGRLGPFPAPRRDELRSAADVSGDVIDESDFKLSAPRGRVDLDTRAMGRVSIRVGGLPARWRRLDHDGRALGAASLAPVRFVRVIRVVGWHRSGRDAAMLRALSGSLTRQMPSPMTHCQPMSLFIASQGTR